ncbi:MAG: alpha/beta fold hydrolase [Pseudomonadales bacterium]
MGLTGNATLAGTLAWLATATLSLALASAASAADGYDYPIENPYLATVAGTPEPLQAQLPKLRIKTRRLPLPADRQIPEVLAYGRKLEYSIAAQRGPAPLIFAIAGTGGYHNSGTNIGLLKAFHSAGFHVVGISSPTHPKFQIGASSTGVPGVMDVDGEDLLNVMRRIRTQLKDKLQVTEYHLTGYSLGGMHAAFVAQRDQANGAEFDFQRVLLINSPVSLYSSISKLDRMLENVPGGVDNFDRYFDGVVRQISDAYTRSTSVEFNQDLVYAAFQANPPTREDLAAVIGTAFRLSAMNMIFTADVMSNFGFIKPREQRLPANADLDAFLQVALRVGLTDYFHEFVWPFYQERYPNLDRERFADAQSLPAIETFLRSSPNIFAIHNQDDIILTGTEIDFFRTTFGNRAKIYQRGGHLGNTNHHATVAHMLAVMTNDQVAGQQAVDTEQSAYGAGGQ